MIFFKNKSYYLNPIKKALYNLNLENNIPNNNKNPRNSSFSIEYNDFLGFWPCSGSNLLEMFGNARDGSDIGFTSLLKEIQGVKTLIATVFGTNQQVQMGILSDIMEAVRDVKIDTGEIKIDTKKIIKDLSDLMDKQINQYENFLNDIGSVKSNIANLRTQISDFEDNGEFDRADELQIQISQLRDAMKNLFNQRDDRLKNIMGNVENILEIQKITDSYLKNKIDNLEDYLKSHLGSDWEKLKDTWQLFKDGKIKKRGLIKSGIKIFGKKFLAIFLLFR